MVTESKYINRELSWLEFNDRILGEARDKTLPLLERLKFLSITASNLDEFFMVRVGSLTDMREVGYDKPDIAGYKVGKQLELIGQATHTFMNGQYQTFNRGLMPALEKEKIELITQYEDLTAEEKQYTERFFAEEIYPVLTPMAVDSSRPFPLIRNKSLNIAALLAPKVGVPTLIKTKNKKKNKEAVAAETELEFATVQVPSGLPRLIPLSSEKTARFVLLEEIIEQNIDKLFLNYDVVCAYPYRITRNADLDLEEEEAEDLLEEIARQIKKRKWGRAIRLEVQSGMDKRLLKTLQKQLQLKPEWVYALSGPLDLTFLMKLSSLAGFDHLRNKPFVPKKSPMIDPKLDIFENIKKGDILMHHPYETFDPVVEFVRKASEDPDVLAIKQTLYRVSGNSPIIAALARAADNGKQVSVLVELKARFDEENNINWARMLEHAGCHVIYGLVGLKTHSKITLVVRREEEGIVRYVHLGTGNYNDQTAKLYTDMGLFTCNYAIGEDATAVFNMLSGYSEPMTWNKLVLAPHWMRDRFLYLIRRETNHALEGRKARILAKMNSLCDQEIIDALYEASAAGVEIKLVVRGICCLKAGVPGLSENIEVISIVGNFLEHSRIFCFYNDNSEEVYMSSADWMPRNLDRRVEILFPIEDEDLKKRTLAVMDVLLSDNGKARRMLPDGSYERVTARGKTKVIAQEYFCKEATQKEKEIKKEEEGTASHTFKPKSGV
ncbi:MAG: RNA degradosome polyphosphate kinase [Lachnospiraceae bacterium]|nr:RNA degradosome polyphosphate kinase [Lachnospiraceae bacterium]